MIPSSATSCAVCGATGHSCGPQTDTVPIDIPEKEAAVSGELNEYEVEISGQKTTMQLDEADAERLGAVPVPEGEDDAGAEDHLVTSEKAGARPANKARTAPNK